MAVPVPSEPASPPPDGGGGGRGHGRDGRSRGLLVAVVGLAVLAGLTVPGLVLWQRFSDRPVDHTEAHGDDCLPEPVDGLFRCWDLLVPDEIDVEGGGSAAERPLVIDLHGFGGHPEQQRTDSGFAELAADEEFIAVWPYGIERSWNGGGRPWADPEAMTAADRTEDAGCCGPALVDDVDDVAFIRAMVDRLATELPVDRDQVFVTGFSNGCFLAQRVAAEADDLIAGVACMAGYSSTEVALGYSPVPVLEIHGTGDEVIAYDDDFRPGAVANFARWRDRNRCQANPREVWSSGPHVMIQVSDCAEGADVALVTLVGVGHDVYPPDSGIDVDVATLAWDFLQSVG